MLDILIPCEADQTEAAIATLKSFVTDTDVGVRLCVLMHGSARLHFKDLDHFLLSREVTDENERSKSFEFMVGHESKNMRRPVIYDRLAGMIKNKLAALTTPGIVLNDPKWFGKMQQTFLKDPRNMACFALPFTNVSLPPLRCLPNQPVHGDIILGMQDFRTILSSINNTLEEDLRRNVRALGGNRWSTTAVRYIDACPERSEPQANLFE